MVTTAPAKELTDSERLLTKFNQWVDERIADYEEIPAFYRGSARAFNSGRVDALMSAKLNLKRLYQEILNEGEQAT